MSGRAEVRRVAATEELASIGTRFADGAQQSPRTSTNTDVYLLRDMEMDSPGLAYAGPFAFVGGDVRVYGHSYDLDSFALPSVERFRTIAMRRSPAWSRPPSNFAPEWKGRFYTVWRRVGPSPLVHIPLGGGFEPSATPSIVHDGGGAELCAARPAGVWGSSRGAPPVLALTSRSLRGRATAR